MNWLRNFLQYPLTRGMDLDDPMTTNLRRTILEQKPFLRKVYQEWYRLLFQYVPGNALRVLEIGSGAGSSEQQSAPVVRTDILHAGGIDVQCNAQALPFPDGAFQSVLMINVLHHLHQPELFFEDADRCLENGGTLCMLEPWNTPWSALIYPRFHHEPFDPSSPDWGCGQGGPLSHSNQAIPWIIFGRDQALFRQRYPQFHIEVIRPLMPLVYLLSGGISLRNLMPGFTYPFWRWMEQGFESRQGLFALIVLRKKPAE